MPSGRGGQAWRGVAVIVWAGGGHLVQATQHPRQVAALLAPVPPRRRCSLGLAIGSGANIVALMVTLSPRGLSV